MKTLIVYATKYGCTEKCAKILLDKIIGEVELCNLKTTNDIDISRYNRIIIGGSIYMGKIQKEVNSFCKKNLKELTRKNTGVFVCCMGEKEIAREQLNNAFPRELIENAIAKEYFGGEFNFKRMNFLERLIVKKVAKTDKDISRIINENIERFAKIINDTI